jgi:hypothetical protein
MAIALFEYNSPGLVLSNLVFVLKCQTDVIETFEQALAAKGINLEA